MIRQNSLKKSLHDCLTWVELFPHIIIKPLSHRPSGMIYSYFCSSFALPFVLISLFLVAYFNWKPFPSISFEGSPFDHLTRFYMTSLVAQKVKHLPTMWEAQVRSLGQEDPLEKAMAPHFSTLAWKIPWMEECGRLQSMGSQRVRHDWATSLHVSIVQMILYAISIN